MNSTPSTLSFFLAILMSMVGTYTQANLCDHALDSNFNLSQLNITELVTQYDYRKSNEFKQAILARPAHERLTFLKALSLKELIQRKYLLDTLFGLRINELNNELKASIGLEWGPDYKKVQERYGDEEIWYDSDGGHQSDWEPLLEAVSAMNLKPGQTVSDLGSGIGRLGLLIGLLHPEVNFIGLELVDERVKYANEAAQELGFKNVKYQTENLALADLPRADHFYMFNPTNRQTSEIVAKNLLKLSQEKDFRVYILFQLNSQTFFDRFKSVSRGYIRVFEPIKL